MKIVKLMFRYGYPYRTGKFLGYIDSYKCDDSKIITQYEELLEQNNIVQKSIELYYCKQYSKLNKLNELEINELICLTNLTHSSKWSKFIIIAYLKFHRFLYNCSEKLKQTQER